MKVRVKNEIITQNTVITPDGWSGWRCMNLGSDSCTVDGVPLRANTTETYRDTIDFTNLDPDVVYDSSIKIIFGGTYSSVPKLLLTRLYYKK